MAATCVLKMPLNPNHLSIHPLGHMPTRIKKPLPTVTGTHHATKLLIAIWNAYYTVFQKRKPPNVWQ